MQINNTRIMTGVLCEPRNYRYNMLLVLTLIYRVSDTDTGIF